MCIAICVPPKLSVTKQTLRTCWNNNPHGAGYMFVELGDKPELIVRKGYMKFRHLYRNLMHDMRDNQDSYFVIHFRYASRGERTEFNTHPHVIHDKHSAMVHNGTIYNTAVKNAGDSDTLIFARDILQHLPQGFQHSEGIQVLIEDYIGNGKIIYLDTNNQPVIYNRILGVTDDDIWYSNDYYYTDRYKKKLITSDNDTHNNYGTQGNSSDTLCEICGKHVYTKSEINYAMCYICMDKYNVFGDNEGNYSTHYNSELRHCKWCRIELDPDEIEYENQMCDECYNIARREHIHTV